MFDIISDTTPHAHPAIQLCLQTARAAHAAACAQDKTRFDCEETFKEAYLKALPALATQESISDFIACVTYAHVIGVIYRNDCKGYLYGAQVALTAARRAPAKPPKAQAA